MRVCLVSAATATDFEDASEAVSSGVRGIAAEPHLGILALASALEQCGRFPQIVDLNRLYYEYLATNRSGVKGFADWAAAAIGSPGIDVYGLSSICSTYPLTIRIAECLKRKRPDCKILLGGPQASVVDLQTLDAFPFVDFILRGEADDTLPLFLEELAGKGQLSSIPGLSYRGPFGPVRNGPAPLIENLDALPLPAYHLAGGLKGVLALPLELGRGCPFACTFCSTNDFFRRKFRLKSPQRILADMRSIASDLGFRKFDLVHDMFTIDRRRVAAFCNHMLESGEKFTWACSARTDCVDEELLALMAKAGCYGVFFGVETGSRRMQRIIDKDLDPDRAKTMIETAERLGIATTVSMISGFPEETWSDVRESMDVYMHSMRHPRSSPQFNLLAPLAGTPIHREYRDQLVLEDLCSYMGHQGRIHNDADRELIRKYPDIFPNFYLTPTPGLERAVLLELREFLLNCSTRLRWLATALHQTGPGILDIFFVWQKHRLEIHPHLRGGSLRQYYTSDRFRNDFVHFVRQHGCSAGNCAVDAFLDYYETFARAENEAASVARAQPVNGPMLPGDIPARKSQVHVIELDWDIQGAIDALKRAERPDDIRQRKLYRTDMTCEGNIRLVEITPLLARTLQTCDGQRTVQECITELGACIDCSEQLRYTAGEYLLEHVFSEGLIEVYRPEPTKTHPASHWHFLSANSAF